MNSEDYRTFALQEIVEQKRLVEELGLNSKLISIPK